MNCYKNTFVVQVNSYKALFTFDKLFMNDILNDESRQWIIVSRAGEDEKELVLAELEEKAQESGKPVFCFDELKAKNNVFFLQMPEESSIAECYNTVFDAIKSDYVCFTNQYVKYDKSTLNAIDAAIETDKDANLISINYKNLAHVDEFPETKEEFNIYVQDLNNGEKILSFLPAYFVKTSFIGDLRFNDVCEEESATAFLMELWKKDSNPVIVEDVFCYYDSKRLSLKSSAFYGCGNKNFYINSLRHNYLDMIHSYIQKGEAIPDWLIRITYYRLYFKYYSNYNVRNKFLLDDKETEEFFQLTREILQFIPDELIMDNMQYEQFAPPFSLRNLFAYLKYDGDLGKLDRKFEIDDENLYYYQCGIKYDLTAHRNIIVRAFNVRNGNLSIDLKYFTNLLYEYNPKAIRAYLNGKEYPCQKNNIYNLDKVFGVAIEKGYTFAVDFPLEEVLKDNAEICFTLTLDDKEYRLPLIFIRPASKLHTYCKNAYWKINDQFTVIHENDSLIVRAFSRKELREREKLFCQEAASIIRKVTKNKESAERKIEAVIKLRKAYFRNYRRFKKRRIWLFFDKLYKAGDNGEYAFRHAMTRNDGVECYYIINEDSLDYPRLKKEFPKNILIYDTFKCQLYGLLAENIIATHPDIIEFCGMRGTFASVVKDLFNPNLVCIAHGITIQKNADYQNRLFDNTMFYTTSSKYEVTHILQDVYGYREDEVALTGMARFDGLKSNDQRQILITPTWRRNLVGSAKRNTVRQYKGTFKETDYYKIYNGLINDERIIEVAKRTGYKIIFLLHPSMSAQIDDYDRNDYVDIIPATGDMSYEKILTESSLMVTDYSGIHYDFGYMRKPVIYYQPVEVPMRFDEGGMKFATMGFGPLCTQYEEAVSLICEYMENECVLPEEYKRRADDFFAFDDYDNSRRIYDAVLEWTNKRKPQQKSFLQRLFNK